MGVPRKPFLALLILSPLLTELLSGSTSVLLLVNPFHVLLQVIGYSLPVLFIRELAVRWKLSILGLFALGIGYGILNEGVIAETFLRVSGSPLPAYDQFGIIAGINIPFALIISIWHALHAVIFPIMIVHFFYPQASKLPWFGIKKAWLLPVPAIVVGILISSMVGTLAYCALFLVAIGVLVVIARILPGMSREVSSRPFSLKTVILGMLFALIHFWGAFVLASAKVSLGIFILYALFSLALFVFVLRWRGWLQPPNIIGFGIGSYFVFAIVGGLLRVALAADILHGLAEIVLMLFLGVLVIRLKRRERKSR